jgi:hypothetical protein
MFFKDKIAVSNLKVELEKAQSKIQELEYKIKDLTIAIDSSNQEFVIDFNAIRCFSIERQDYGYTGKTILGYNLLNDSENHGPREWTLYCSEKQHQKLIDQFNRTKENNGTL